jgi:lambda repressor-like predicted transcriptional regulator
MTSPTQQKIALALEKKGTNLCAWSKANGYNYKSVWRVVSQWAGRTDRTPHGGIARLIMKDLEMYVNESDKNTVTQFATENAELRHEVATQSCDMKKRVATNN